MAKVSYIDLVPEIENKYYSGLQPGDRFQYARVGRKNTLLSVKAKKGLTQKSLLPEIATVWNALSAEQKSAWGAAGAQMLLNGYRLFTQEYCARRVNNLSGGGTPSLLHQSWVGQIHVGVPASEVKLVQVHPHFYYIQKKVLGKKSMYSPVMVNESISLPFTLGLNYNANLTAVGPDSFAKFYAKFWYSYQGVNRSHLLEIPLDYFTDWKTDSATLEVLLSIVVRYDLYFHLYNVQGDIYFDNVKAIHSVQNWARDPFCKDINQGFTRNFYQIPKHWSAEIAPPGVLFESVYREF